MKKGFTLAEVLITLAIIGVVAALTIPAVVYKYQKHAQYTQFMKVYNTLSNAFQLAQGEYGSVKSWDYDGSDMVDNYLAKYLNIISSQDIPNYDIKTLDGQSFGAMNAVVSGNVASPKYYTLSDGSAFLIPVAMENFGIVVAVDTNGVKAPNTFGRDIFQFIIGSDSDNDLLTPSTKSGDNNQNCSADGTPDEGEFSGIGCADRLLKEGKMNY